MKNRLTKETFVMAIFSFQAQPSKAIGKTVLLPLICARLTEVTIWLVTNKERGIKWSIMFSANTNYISVKFQDNGFDFIESEKFKEAVYVQAFGHAKNSQVGRE